MCVRACAWLSHGGVIPHYWGPPLPRQEQKSRPAMLLCWQGVPPLRPLCPMQMVER